VQAQRVMTDSSANSVDLFGVSLAINDDSASV
jgi:hypothetical protein